MSHLRPRALIAVLLRAARRISEALALTENDIDVVRGWLLVRHGRGDKRREAGMDPFGFEQLLDGPPRIAPVNIIQRDYGTWLDRLTSTGQLRRWHEH